MRFLEALDSCYNILLKHKIPELLYNYDVDFRFDYNGIDIKQFLQPH